jgi:hypothetical protein
VLDSSLCRAFKRVAAERRFVYLAVQQCDVQSAHVVTCLSHPIPRISACEMYISETLERSRFASMAFGG